MVAFVSSFKIYVPLDRLMCCLFCCPIWWILISSFKNETVIQMLSAASINDACTLAVESLSMDCMSLNLGIWAFNKLKDIRQNANSSLN